MKLILELKWFESQNQFECFYIHLMKIILQSKKVKVKDISKVAQNCTTCNFSYEIVMKILRQFKELDTVVFDEEMYSLTFTDYWDIISIISFHKQYFSQVKHFEDAVSKKAIHENNPKIVSNIDYSSNHIEIRDSFSVINDLIDTSTNTLKIMISYADISTSNHFIKKIMHKLELGVSVYILLRSMTDMGDYFSEFVKSNMGRIDNLYVKIFNGEGNLHAKSIISDATSAYIGSANFLKSSLHKNLELGLLVTGQTAEELGLYFDQIWKNYTVDIYGQ